jgi:hypothetical protein
LIQSDSGWKKATQTKEENVKELIIRLTGATALAITLVMTGSRPLCAQSAPRPALTLFNLTYQYSLLKMQIEARHVGLTIDTDIDVLVGGGGHVLFATIDGFENIVLDENGPNEFDFGFVNVAGIDELPDGNYRMHCVVDLRIPEAAVVSHINSRGEVFTYTPEVIDDPHPDRGARKGLAIEGIEGGNLVALNASIPNTTGTDGSVLQTTIGTLANGQIDGAGLDY